MTLKKSGQKVAREATAVASKEQFWNPLVEDIRAFAALFLEKRDQERAE